MHISRRGFLGMFGAAAAVAAAKPMEALAPAEVFQFGFTGWKQMPTSEVKFFRDVTMPDGTVKPLFLKARQIGITQLSAAMLSGWRVTLL